MYYQCMFALRVKVDKLNIKKLPKAISFHKQLAGKRFLKVPLNEPHRENKEHYDLQKLCAC